MSDPLHLIDKLTLQSNSKPSATAIAHPVVETVQPLLSEADKTLATHLLVNGHAVAIESAHIRFVAGAIELSKGAANLAELIAEGKIKSAADQAVKLPLLKGERLISAMADNVITGIHVG